MKSKLAVVGILLFTLACGQKPTDEKLVEIEVDTSITLNFNENIRSLDPLKASSNSEVFVRSLVFNKLIENVSHEKIESQLIRSVVYDTLQRKYTFELFENVSFHNDKIFDNSDVEALFRTLLDVEKYPSAANFFGQIWGYYGDKTSLPSGIQFFGNYTITILLNNQSENFLGLLASAPFYVSNENSGTGSFQITDLNDDISCSLKRVIDGNKPNQITAIEIRFIKNKDEELAEFFEGNLDIILYDQVLDSSTLYDNYISTTIKGKYPDYQVNTGNHALVQYAKIYNVRDSTTYRVFMNNFPVLQDQVYIPSPLVSRSLDDSATLETNPLYYYVDQRLHQIDLLLNETFVEIREISDTLSKSHFTLNEIILNDYAGEPSEAMNRIVKTETNELQYERQLICLTRIESGHVLSRLEIKGIKDYMSMTEIVKNAYIQPAQKY